MTEKELRKLNRYELLEMMVAQAKKMERLERELAEANEKLKERELIMTSSGTMAEAALRLSMEMSVKVKVRSSPRSLHQTSAFFSGSSAAHSSMTS